MTDVYMRDLAPIVEMQALELKRLMRDKDQLNGRIDALIEEISWLREMQQQDQTLREKEQALRLQMQDTVNDLIKRAEARARKTTSGPSARPAKRLPSANPQPSSEKTTLVRRDNDRPLSADDGKEIGIPAFLMADSLDGARNGAEPPIKKLITRIRARQEQS